MAAGARAAGADALERPIADGGEGTFDVLAPRFSASEQVPCAGPLGEPVRGRVGMLDDNHAFIESADACGIRHLQASERRPLGSSTFGVGQLLVAALKLRPRVTIGLGGSATVDLGTGAAAALGVRFIDRQGRPIAPTPRAVLQVHHVEIPDLHAQRGRVSIWCDVAAPLTGPGTSGLSFVRQKGVAAVEDDLVRAAWAHTLELFDRAGAPLDASQPGAGAAGGLGLVLNGLLDAPLLGGAEQVCRQVELDDAVRAADLVLTGEGRFDRQSLSGKAPAWVMGVAARHGVPVVVLAGAVAAGLEVEGVTLTAVSAADQPLQVQLRQTLQRVRDAAERAVAGQTLR